LKKQRKGPQLRIVQRKKVEQDPWLAQFSDATTERSIELLESRFDSVSEIWLKPLCEKVLRCTSAMEIVDQWLHIQSPPAFDNGAGNKVLEYYLQAPLPAETIRECLQQQGFENQPSVAKFLEFFNGFRESEPHLCGSFVDVREWNRIDNSEALDEKTQGLEDWSDGVILFEARNGDLLLLHPTGRTAWYSHEESLIRGMIPRFELFIQKYAAHLEYNWPFDSWGPPDEVIKRVSKRLAH
jgi:hypothetical protein